jgi:UDP-GlcNAc:undecaprenyl-phosphate GlcNAc-1-phosphate transferase
MGNAGSHFLGFTLAAIAMIISYAPLERKVALVSPILILGFPIFDTAFLILIRWKNKRPILKKSKDHLSLRFLNLGYSKRKALIYMLLLGILFSFSGILVSQLTNQLGVCVIAVVLIIALALTKRMSKVSDV